MFAARWHYTRDGRRSGPVSAATVRELVDTGVLGPADWVWQPGMDGWEPASKLAELLEEPAVVDGNDTPPPLPTPSPRPRRAEPVRPAVRPTARERLGGRPNERKRPASPVLVGCLALLGACVCCCGGLAVFGAFGKRAADEAEQARQAEQRAAAGRELAEADELWEKGRYEDAYQKYQVLAGAEVRNRLDEFQQKRVNQRRAEGEVRAGVADADRQWERGERTDAAEKYLAARRPDSNLDAETADRITRRLTEYTADRVRQADRDWQAGRRAEAVSAYRDLAGKKGLPTAAADRETMAARIAEVEAEEARADVAAADRDWTAGRKDDAYRRYKRVAERKDLLDTFSTADKQVLAQRIGEHEATLRERERVEAAKQAEETRKRMAELQAEAAKKEKADRLDRLKKSKSLDDNVTALIEEEEGVVIVKCVLVKIQGNQYEGEIVSETGAKGYVGVTAQGGVISDKKILAKWQWLPR